MHTPENGIHLFFTLVKYSLFTLLYLLWAIVLGSIISVIIMLIIFFRG